MEYKALLLEKEGKEQEKLLLSALNQTGVLSSCYAYKSRVKSEEKLIEKVKIRHDEGYVDYSIADITDVVGLRLITLFRVDMPNLFEKILKIVTHQDSLTPNPFKKDTIKELIFYTNRFEDNIGLSLRNVAVKLKVEDKYELKQRGGEYSSIHIVTRLNKRIQKLSNDTSSYYLPVEIQIRTVFEDAWGEVDHKYGYPIRKGKTSPYKIKNPKAIMRHLDNLKKFSDACGEYADAIHIEIAHDVSEETPAVNLQPVESDQKTINLFHDSNIDLNDIDKYIEARRIREKGLAKRSEYENDYIEVLLDAAEIFRQLSEKYRIDNLISDRNFYYYTRMNYAFCLLSSRRQPEGEKALHIYEEVENEYSSYLLVKMRLAQAYGQNGFIDLSLKKCEEVLSVLKSIEDVGFTETIELPETDYKHIQRFLRKIYGYYLWEKSNTIKVINHHAAIKKSGILLKAWCLTNDSLINDVDKKNIYNNLLYYSIEIAEITAKYPKVRIRKEVFNTIESNLEELLKLIDVDSTEDFMALDTIAKVYNYIGKIEERDKILKRIIPLASKSLRESSCDNDIVVSIINEAKVLIGAN